MAQKEVLSEPIRGALTLICTLTASGNPPQNLVEVVYKVYPYLQDTSSPSTAPEYKKLRKALKNVGGKLRPLFMGKYREEKRAQCSEEELEVIVLIEANFKSYWRFLDALSCLLTGQMGSGSRGRAPRV